MRSLGVITVLVVGLLCSGCTVLTVGGAVVGTAVSVTATVVDVGVSAAGAVAKGTIKAGETVLGIDD